MVKATLQFTEDQVHRILLEHYFFFTIAQTCAKWGITPHRLRQWKKRGTAGAFWTVEDCIIAAIHRGGVHQPADLIGWLDYRNHSLYSAAEVEKMLVSLEKRGDVVRQDGGWAYVQVDPPYIFGPLGR